MHNVEFGVKRSVIKTLLTAKRVGRTVLSAVVKNFAVNGPNSEVTQLGLIQYTFDSRREHQVVSMASSTSQSHQKPQPPPGRPPPPQPKRSKSSGIMQQLAWMAKRPSSYGQFGDGVVGVVEMRPMSDKKTGHSEEVLGEEWEEFIDAAGNKYYRNTQTDERSRERPMRRLQSSSVLTKSAARP